MILMYMTHTCIQLHTYVHIYRHLFVYLGGSFEIFCPYPILLLSVSLARLSQRLDWTGSPTRTHVTHTMGQVEYFDSMSKCVAPKYVGSGKQIQQVTCSSGRHQSVVRLNFLMNAVFLETTLSSLETVSTFGVQLHFVIPQAVPKLYDPNLAPWSDSNVATLAASLWPPRLWRP